MSPRIYFVLIDLMKVCYHDWKFLAFFDIAKEDYQQDSSKR